MNLYTISHCVSHCVCGACYLSSVPPGVQTGYPKVFPGQGGCGEEEDGKEDGGGAGDGVGVRECEHKGDAKGLEQPLTGVSKPI